MPSGRWCIAAPPAGRRPCPRMQSGLSFVRARTPGPCGMWHGCHGTASHSAHSTVPRSLRMAALWPPAHAAQPPLHPCFQSLGPRYHRAARGCSRSLIVVGAGPRRGYLPGSVNLKTASGCARSPGYLLVARPVGRQIKGPLRCQTVSLLTACAHRRPLTTAASVCAGSRRAGTPAPVDWGSGADDGRRALGPTRPRAHPLP